MRKSEAYYKALMSEAKNFLELIDDYEFVYRQVIKTKQFKEYIQEKLDKATKPLFFYDMKKNSFVYQ